jgi:8-oxo-dGTP pyrophosphatase MutT (NUDIX family)
VPDGTTLAELLAGYRPAPGREEDDVAETRALLAADGDPYDRSTPLHVTCSALVLHPPSGRVLLRWHARQQAWLQVGGHGDPGEVDPFAVAVREAVEETGLTDVVAWPGPEPVVVHLAVVPVPANDREPAHRHADVRFALATARPDDAAPESDDAPLRWLSFAEAAELTGEDNLRITLERLRRVHEQGAVATPGS